MTAILPSRRALQRRNASAWSLTDCILFTLETKDFYQVLKQYDDKDNSLYDEMKGIALSQSAHQEKINTCHTRRQSFDPQLPGASTGARTNESEHGSGDHRIAESSALTHAEAIERASRDYRRVQEARPIARARRSLHSGFQTVSTMIATSVGRRNRVIPDQ